MDVNFKIENELGVITVAGRLDALTAAEFEKQCLLNMEQGVNGLILDLTNLDYISSAGLRGILAIAKKLKASGKKLCLCGLRGIVEEVISLSGFNNMLPIYTDTNEALKECSGHGK